MHAGNNHAYVREPALRLLVEGELPAERVLAQWASRRPPFKGASDTRVVRLVPKEMAKEVALAEAHEEKLAQAQSDLQRLIGLDEVKRTVHEIQAFVSIQEKRSAALLTTQPLALHMIFKGNPGTGKTTVARILGRMFEAMGVLPKGHLIECERADLVGEYIGHTAQKTRERIKEAMGGILFIDEAYSLARGGEKDFGKEAIDTLVKAMEDHKDRIVLILAGYRREMTFFLDTNPGLRSRFPIHIDFPDYSSQELLQIASLMLQEREYRLTGSARLRFQHALGEWQDAGSHKGNARAMRNIIEKAIRRQAVRLMKRKDPSRTDLVLITDSDVEEALAPV